MWQAKQDKQGQFQAEQDTRSLYIKGMDTYRFCRLQLE